MGEAIDHLKVKLSLVVVPAHTRRTGGEVVHVDAYTYDSGRGVGTWAGKAGAEASLRAGSAEFWQHEAAGSIARTAARVETRKGVPDGTSDEEHLATLRSFDRQIAAIEESIRKARRGADVTELRRQRRVYIMHRKTMLDKFFGGVHPDDRVARRG
jgi:hypothetical protein